MERIAIINSVIDFGSTGALTRQLYEYGKNNGYEPYVYHGRGAKLDDSNIIRIDSALEFYLHKFMTLLTGYQGYFSNVATSRLIGQLDKLQVKKVILLNLHGYYLNEKRLLTFLKANNIQTVYVTPDEYAGLGKCCYNRECEKYKTQCDKCPYTKDYPRSLFFDRSKAIFDMKKEVYTGFKSLILVGPETNLVKFRKSALVKDIPMKRVSWGIDLKLYNNEIDDTVYVKYGIPRDKIIILTVAKYSDGRKGVKEYFFEIAKRLQNSNYHFINIGYDGDLKRDEIPMNMTTISYLDDQKELAHLYALSDMYVLASTTDTMPISCLMSFACGTPVCCFYTSGLKYLAERDNPAIKYCDNVSVDALEKIVKNIEKKDTKCKEACRKLAEDEYSIEAFNRKVYEIFE